MQPTESQTTADAFTFPHFGERPRPRFRAHQWINTKFYDTAEARDTALKELRA